MAKALPGLWAVRELRVFSERCTTRLLPATEVLMPGLPRKRGNLNNLYMLVPEDIAAVIKVRKTVQCGCEAMYIEA